MDKPSRPVNLHKIESNDEVLVKQGEKEKHWNILDRIKRKFDDDVYLKKLFSCLNHYNSKNKNNLITFMMIIEYIREDESGSSLALADRYRFTLFTAGIPKYTDRLDGGKTSDVPLHIQLMIGRITGCESNDKLDHIMFDIKGLSIPGTNMYKKLEKSGLFTGNICCTGIIGSEGKYEPIPKRFLMLR